MRLTHTAICLAFLFTSAVTLSGCTSESASKETPEGSLPIRIGLMQHEAALPFWVAEEEGYYAEEGLDVTIDVFPSGADRNAALSADAVDAVLGDPPSVPLLTAGGFPVKTTTVLLGCTPEEGRDGIVVGPDSTAESLEDLKGVPVGTSLTTHQEYIVDRLFEAAGIDEADVVKEEVKKIPIRYELLMEGQLEAAALPEPWITLAVSEGARLVADDTTGRNLSQEVLFADAEWLESDDGGEAMRRLLVLWDRAVETLNEDPDSWHDTLVEHGGVPERIVDVFKVSVFPSSKLPTQDVIDDQTQWLIDKGLLEEWMDYEEQVWTFQE